MKEGFDSEKYISAQTKEIIKRVKRFKRLYLEIGGKLSSDGHASRVLPGFNRDNKINILRSLKPEIIYCISAIDLESKRTLSTKKRSYEKQALKDLSDIVKNKLSTSFVVITRYSGQKKADLFKEKMQRRGYLVIVHYEISGYLKDMEKTLQGFEKQPYIPTTNNLVIITGPAGNSGKMSTALAQVYHETKMGQKTGFAKYETFPIHNLPIDHPINVAYEAGTADLGDVNMIDPYSKKKSVNYNRDIENFRILKKIMEGLTGEKNPFGYESPTDMGINMAKEGIVDDAVCRVAAEKEIYARYWRYKKEYDLGRENIKTIKRMNEILEKINQIIT